MATTRRPNSERPQPEEVMALAGPDAPGPRGRPSWSGLLRLSLVAVPVKAYPACSSSAAGAFHQLHAHCGQRIQHQKRCPLHGAVDASDIERGFQFAPDQYVVIQPEELNKLRPAKDRALVLEHFLPRQQVDPVLFAGRSLYLVPDGLAARHSYGVVAEALQQGGQWALGRVVLSSQRQLVLVRPRGQLLVMDVLHYPAALRAPSTWEAGLDASKASAEEIRLTRALMEANSGPLVWARWRDDTTEELTALVQAKIAGRPLPAPAENSGAVLQLLQALQQSVAAAKDNPKAGQGTSPKPRFPRRAKG